MGLLYSFLPSSYFHRKPFACSSIVEKETIIGFMTRQAQGQREGEESVNQLYGEIELGSLRAVKAVVLSINSKLVDGNSL